MESEFKKVGCLAHPPERFLNSPTKLALWLLADTARYYGEDPSRRSVRYSQWKKSSTCTYMSEDSGNRCAIGRCMEAYHGDMEGKSASSVVFEWDEAAFPDWVISMDGGDLDHIQILHDDNEFWEDGGGLSYRGKVAYRRAVEALTGVPIRDPVGVTPQ